VKETVRKNSSPMTSEIKNKSIAYYKVLYTKQGRSGLFRDSAGYEMLQRDALDMQQRLAHRILTATVEENRSETAF
jgi:hypothetical protein